MDTPHPGFGNKDQLCKKKGEEGLTTLMKVGTRGGGWNEGVEEEKKIVLLKRRICVVFYVVPPIKERGSHRTETPRIAPLPPFLEEVSAKKKKDGRGDRTLWKMAMMYDSNYLMHPLYLPLHQLRAKN
eukprot:TRINITY_DN1792_c0_g1_i4.p2 TRINITY_DN1792_c0_g1~~TRINITY_DN1792_c0_g1_i4.p2  ORF type:complete len:128 (-),score=4.42 TRINITY_DN1792_c0_g1_i4:673-1056(-)